MKNVEEKEQKLIEYKSQNLKLFATSSVQSHSVPPLHIIYPALEVLFIINHIK